jgi:hypothetical protein
MYATVLRWAIAVIAYSYHWTDANNELIVHWDNTPHFPDCYWEAREEKRRAYLDNNTLRLLRHDEREAPPIHEASREAMPSRLASRRRTRGTELAVDRNIHNGTSPLLRGADARESHDCGTLCLGALLSVTDAQGLFLVPALSYR